LTYGERASPPILKEKVHRPPMRQSLKVAISLLASLILFAGFAVFAFSGLFTVLQTSFFMPRIEKAYAAELGSIAARIDAFHDGNREAYGQLAKKDFVAGSFAASLPDATLKAWADLVSQTGIAGVRLIGADGRRIVFSTYDGDVKQRAANRIAFKNYNEDGTDVDAAALTEASASGTVLMDGGRGVFIYAAPVSVPGEGGVAQTGTLAVAVAVRDLLSQLALSSGYPVNQVTILGSRGLLVNGPQATPGLQQGIFGLWDANPSARAFAAQLPLKSADGALVGWRLFSVRLSHGGMASMLWPASTFEMTDMMKGLLLATFFLTFFLLIYLLLNLRSDPLEVLRQRVKRFQIQLITELVESPGGADWTRWRREMESRKDEITWQIQRGLGRISRKQRPVIDEYMEKSWVEIIELISRRAETPAVPVVGAMDFTRLEALIKTALQNVNLAAPAARPAQPASSLKVEEISVAEVMAASQGISAGTEPSRVGATGAEAAEAEAVEELPEAEAVEAEAVEEVPEAEAAEAEAVEELPEAEAAEAEAVEEVPEAEAVEAEAVEEVPEAEAAEAEAVEEVPEAEAAEAEALEEVREAEAAEAEAVEEVPEAEAAEAVPLEAQSSELEPIGPAGSVSGDSAEITDIIEIEIPAAAAQPQAPTPSLAAPQMNQATEAAPAPAPAPRETSELPAMPSDAEPEPALDLEDEELGTAVEQLEELLPLAEIQPLPPLPFEEGLEMLPFADDNGLGGARMAAISALSDDLPGADEQELDERAEPPAEEEPIVHAASGASAPDGKGPSRAEARTVESAEDVEELEALDEEAASAAEDGEPESMEERSELALLQKSSVVRTWTIEAMQKIVDESRSAIVMENGVFRIKDELYAAGERGREVKDAELREIAREVVHAAPDAAAHAHDEPGLGGIGDLISDEDSVDLSKVVSVERGAAVEELLPMEREKSNPIHLKRNGLDYDEFLSSYPRSFTHTTQMKSLVEVSRRVEAVSAGIFLKKVQGYSVDLTVGLGEKTLPILGFATGTAFHAEALGPRKVVVVDKAPAEIRFLKSLFDQDDLRYMKRLLFVPAVFRGQEAYLFLSFSGETDLNLETILSKLLVQ
jgi:hypothetical protein